MKNQPLPTCLSEEGELLVQLDKIMQHRHSATGDWNC